MLVVTDDQRWDTLWAMPVVRRELAARGVTYVNAFVTDPLCCPDRASLLSGGFYPDETGYLENTGPNSGFSIFNASSTLASELQKLGYRTALAGKYFNDYHAKAGVPPGWTSWTAVTDREDWSAFTGVLGGAGDPAGAFVRKEGYVTDFLRDRLLAFLDETGDAPFFVYFAPLAPHRPATPAPEDRALFADFLYRGRNWFPPGRPDRFGGRPSTRTIATDEFRRDQLRSLQAVDRAVGALVEKIRALGRLEDTVFIYTSDNGFTWGEGGLSGKGGPYEESVRVPLVVALPGGPRGEEDGRLVVANLDIGPTIFELAGLPGRGDGGALPLLRKEGKIGREEVLLQSWGPWVWSAVRTPEAKFIDFGRDRELYDLKADPEERENRAARPEEVARLAEMAGRLDRLRRFSVKPVAPPAARAGQPYRHAFEVWGSGGKAVRWKPMSKLPEGLSFGHDGVLQGTPLKAGRFTLRVAAEMDEFGRHSGKPKRHMARFPLVVTP